MDCLDRTHAIEVVGLQTASRPQECRLHCVQSGEQRGDTVVIIVKESDVTSSSGDVIATDNTLGSLPALL